MNQTMSKGKRNLILVLLSFLAGMVFFIPYFRLSYYDQMIRILGLTNTQLGFIGTSVAFINFICYIPSGYMADKFNSKTLLVVSAFGMAATSLIYSLLPSYTIILIIHGFFSIFSILTFWSPYLKYLRMLGDESEQGKIFGLSEAFRGVIATVISFLCLWVLGVFTNETLGFQAVIWVNVALFILIAIALIFILPKDIKEDTNPSAVAKFRLVDALKLKGTWLTIFVIACGITIYIACTGYLGTYTTQILNLPENIASAISIIRNYIIVFLSGVIGGIIADKLSTKSKAVAIFFACSAAVSLFLIFSSQIIALSIILTLVLSLCFNAIKSTYWSVMGEAGIPLEMTGICTGVISCIGFIPEIIVSPVAGSWIDAAAAAGNLQIGFNKIFILIAIAGVLGILASFLVDREWKKAVKKFDN